MFRSSRPKAALAAASTAMLLLAAACGSPAVVPSVSLSPQTPPAQTESSPTAIASAATAAGSLTISLNSTNSKAEYQTQEQLAGHNLPNVAVGSTTAVKGSIALTNGQVDPSNSKITVDLTSLASDEGRRDSYVKRNTLQTSQYPTAVFTPAQVSGLPATLPASGLLSFQLTGDLTVHGVTKPVTWTVAAEVHGKQLSGKATAPFTITGFGMSLPEAGPVLSVQDAGTLELDFSNVPLGAA
jgi:polyisoprenoid-binding protein YceI